MLKCKMFNLFSVGGELNDAAVNGWLEQLPAETSIVSVTQSSCSGSALGMGEGVRTVLTILYR